METREKNRELISSPLGDCFRFALFLASIVLTWYGFKVIACPWKDFELINNVMSIASQLIIIFLFFIEYTLIVLIFINFCALIKKGFSNLKKWEEDGLIYGLSIGVFIGFFAGIAGGLMMRHIIGLIFGLLGGLTLGLLTGFIDEFKNEK